MKTNLQSILPDWALRVLEKDAAPSNRSNVLVVDVLAGRTTALLWWYKGEVRSVGLTDSSLSLCLELLGCPAVWRVTRAPFVALLDAKVLLRTDLYITSLQVPAGSSPFVIQSQSHTP